MGEIEEITIHCTFELEDSQKILKEEFRYRKTAFWIYAFATFVLITAIVLLVLSFSITETDIEMSKVEIYLSIAVIFLIGVGIYFTPFLINRKVQKLWKYKSDIPITKSWEISEERILIKSDISEDYIAWGNISKVQELNSFFKFYYGEIPMFLPKRTLDQTQIIAIRNIIQQKIDPKNVKLHSK